MRRRGMGVVLTLSVVLLGLAGCGSLFHPQAKEFVAQAQGTSGIETQLNLATMIEHTIQSVRQQPNDASAFDRLHNQLYALKMTACDVTEAQAKTPAYQEAATLRREVKVVFHRLWKVREDPTLRDLHLALLDKRIKELKEALQAVKGTA
jgi:hypothetical protein